MPKPCISQKDWFARAYLIPSSNWNNSPSLWGSICELILRFRSWSCSWMSASYSLAVKCRYDKNCNSIRFVRNMLLLFPAHAASSHWCCFWQPLARELQALVNMVKKGSFAQMDFKNKARCYFLRNPPEGQKKTPLNVTLSGHVSEEPVLFWSFCFSGMVTQPLHDTLLEHFFKSQTWKKVLLWGFCW